MIKFALPDLAFAAYTFDAMTNYNESYREFREATSGNLDLALSEHRKALIHWLNRWGCRQFATDQHGVASKSILEWCHQEAHKLVNYDKEIGELDENDLANVALVYSTLSRTTASHKIKMGKKERVSVGPAGASKILFALRPHAYIPWDQTIRNSLRYGDDGVAYAAYLRDIKLALEALEQSCLDNGFPLQDLPCQLGEPDATAAMLVNAYLWIVHSQDCKPPSRDVLRRWVRWSRVAPDPLD